MGIVVGFDEIVIEVCVCMGDVRVCWLTNFFDKILSCNKMPSE